MKSRQFCSVCKEWLDMEVVPTNDGDEDDGVIWFRCPQCQGFLPKLSGAELKEPAAGGGDTANETTANEPAGSDTKSDAADDGLPWDSPADMMAAQKAAGASTEPESSPFLPEEDDAGEPDANESPAESPAASATPGGMLSDDKNDAEKEGTRSKRGKSDEPTEPSEPIHEYMAMLASLDVSSAAPYRPWETYEVGHCIHHLAWEECGVVVAKEDLPGGRKVIKCYFEDAGVVRLIEQAPR